MVWLADFLTNHAEHVLVFVLTAVAIVRGGQGNAKTQLLNLALSEIRKVAATELSNPEKRKWVVDAMKDKAPALTKFLSQSQLELLVEQAYLLLKADLKSR